MAKFNAGDIVLVKQAPNDFFGSNEEMEGMVGKKYRIYSINYQLGEIYYYLEDINTHKKCIFSWNSKYLGRVFDDF